MTVWKSVLELAAAQGGHVATRQVRDLGMDELAFIRRVRREGWVQVWRGVWRAPGARVDRLGALWSAILACGPHALVTGNDGLWLRGAGRPARGPVRVVTPMASHAPRHLGAHVKVIASRTLRDADAGTARRLPCARASRSFVDLVIPPTPPVARVRDLLIVARQSRVVDLPALQAQVAVVRGVPGLQVLRRAVADVLSVEADSPFSDRVHRRLLRDGFRPDPVPIPVVTPGRTLHPDITFKAQRVALECDSMLAHSEQHELMVDNRKDRAYKLVGWFPLRIGWREYDRHWSGFVGDLRRALAG